MSNNTKYYIVEASALPEVFLKVVEAKRLLDTGKVTTVNDAAKATGISRSAFYKYRDAVMPFQNMMTGRVITIQLLLHDAPGILSNLLNDFADNHVNILTINSIVPTNGCAVVTISAETMAMTVTIEEFVQKLRSNEAILKKPSIAESLDWAAALDALGIKELTPDALRRTAGFVLKNSEDLAIAEEVMAQEDAHECSCGGHCGGHHHG